MTPDELFAQFGVVRRGCLSLNIQVGRMLDEYFDQLEDLQRELMRFLKDYERIKFYAAKRIWATRGEQTPGGAKRIERNEVGETWEQWFERMFGESLADYAAKAKEGSLRERVKAYEIETFGWSPLDEDKKDDAA